ncbi:MAG: CHAD domain-containing protein [Actinobacteria bacterium]|nr:MAG: CHAD domain-containing protein [Actinomycetota bacterium]
MTMGAARPGAAPSHLVVLGEPAAIVKTTLVIAVERMMLHDAEIRRGTDDPEAIHDARVAVRRFRSHTASLSSVLDVDVISSQVEHLGAFVRALGAVRDRDVFLENLAAETAGVPEAIRADAARIASAVALERGAALERLRRSMDAPEHGQLLRTLMSIAVDPPLRRPAYAPDPAVVMSSVWKALARRAKAAGRSSPDPVLHALRIRAKRVRYAAEALAPFVGDRASAFAKAAGRLQDVLGRHQDAVVAIDKLAAVAATDPTLAFAAGWIGAGRERVRVETRAAWPEAWRSLAKKKRRFW